MRNARIALLCLALAGTVALGVWSCGGTGGGTGGAQTGNQFVSTQCEGDSQCLTLTISPLFLDPGDVARFSARLIDANGVPQADVEICFALETPDAAQIFEPSGQCGFTDSSGQVSGGLRSTGLRTGSINFFASAASRNLVVQKTLKFGEGCLIILTPSNGTVAQDETEFLEACITCSDDTVLVNETVAFSGCGDECDLDSQSGTNNTVFGNTGTDGCVGATLINTNTSTSKDPVTITASSPSGGADSSNFVMEGAEPDCGNGVEETGEACDDGNANDLDGCTSSCELGPTCGNSVVETPEQCDDGNVISGDGCSSTCQNEGP